MGANKNPTALAVGLNRSIGFLAQNSGQLQRHFVLLFLRKNGIYQNPTGMLVNSNLLALSNLHLALRRNGKE